MADYSQADRPFRVETVLGPDVLLLQGFSGQEGVSTPFSFTLDLVSEEASVSANDVLRTAAVVTMDLAGGEQRVIHGLINRFVQLGQSDELTFYRAEIVPWVWFLSLSSDCKIFQNLSVLEIVEQVFKDQGYSDFEIKCVRNYASREYCVQYRETHLNFVSRLLEEEGIFYFFQHSESKHILTLADDASAVKPCPGQSRVRISPMPEAAPEEDFVTAFEREHAAYIGTVTLRDYDHLQPSLRLESSVSGDGREEVYDYPGNYTQLDDGERLARLQLEEQEAWHEIVRGESTCRSLQSGCTFDLEEHYLREANQTYQLLQVRHSARAGDYRSWDTAAFEYRNDFVAIPHSVPFRPPRTTPKPVVQGSQSALVVGKAGEEIWVDKHGRVKVQFYWDRDGKKDENSSCWVRVSSGWAGKGWGVIQIPRIGQEVIVDFLEGDPDRPIITGRVYNAEQTPPYDLPGNQTQSGVKSRSSKGGGTDDFNEIRMEDLKGSELLYIHAEKDKQVVVENDRMESVGHNESISISNDRSETVGANESITIEKNRTESVGSNENITIGGNRIESVKKNETIDVGENRTEEVGKNERVAIGQSRTHDVGKDDTLKIGKDLFIDAGDKIVLKTGSSSISMKKNGDIQIKGKNITLEGSGKIRIKASSDVNIKGSKVTNN
ncbi:MAG: type VI secretion system tip protein VgrG [Gemmatimonadota bacterium]|nr:MAG: type VI secretion system tip protein VgrG [Gemmatimonadota bacterium]